MDAGRVVHFSHKKGIASTQLANDLDVTQKTAWFMMHRLRHAARTRSFNRLLRGDVEADETFVGGKDINRLSRERGEKGQADCDGHIGAQRESAQAD